MPDVIPDHPERTLLPASPACDRLDHHIHLQGPPLLATEELVCVDCSLAWRRAVRAGADGDAAVRALRNG